MSAPKLVYFVSDVDGKISTADYDDISLSPIVMGFIEDAEDLEASPIPLSEKTEVIEGVIKFCKMYRHNPFITLLEGYKSYKKPLAEVLPAEFMSLIADLEKQEIFIKVFMCAHFLNISPLVEMIAARIANVVRPDLDKRPSEVKADFIRLGYCSGN